MYRIKVSPLDSILSAYFIQIKKKILKLCFRTIFCAHNAAELDELLHVNPIYRRPSRRQVQPQRSPCSYSTIRPDQSSHNSVNPLSYLINKPANFLTATSSSYIGQSFEPPVGSQYLNEDSSPII